MSDDEWGRRAAIGTIGGFIGGFLFGGGYGFNLGEREGRKEARTDIDVYIFRDGEVYEGDLDDIPYDPGDLDNPDREEGNIESWNDILTDNCSLEEDEREWLESRLDEEYDNLNSQDFFDYIGKEVRIGQIGDEIRMNVDPDYSGEFDADTHYKVEKGYNIPDAC